MKNIFLNSEGKLRDGWWVGVFFAFMAALLIPLILLAKKYSFELAVQHQVILILVVTVICQKLRSRPLAEVTGKLNFRWGAEFLNGSLLGSALMILPAALLTLFGGLLWSINDLTWTTAGNGIYLFMAVAIAEELLFRGFIFQRLIQSVGTWPAQLIIAGLFVLTHIGNPGMTGITLILASVNIFLVSILFGLTYIKTKSLAMAVGLHFFANFIQGPILGFGVSGEKQQSFFTSASDNLPVWLDGGAFGLESSILCFLTLVVMTYIVYKWEPTSKKYNENTHGPTDVNTGLVNSNIN